MCFYIGIEDLAANALIELLKTKEGDLDQYAVTFRELEKYGMEVVKLLISRGEEAILILSRENTNYMFYNYSDLFEETQIEEEPAIKLKKGVTVFELIERFRTYLAFDVMMAFMDEKTVKVLKTVNG